MQQNGGHSYLTRWRGVLCALTAAILFGATTPFAKTLLPRVDPWLLAGLLYLASGIGLFLVRAARRLRAPNASAAIVRSDWPWLGAAILCGGVLAPVLLLIGLRETPASSASLLLNLEGVFTALLAWFVFGENYDRRIVLGMVVITAGALTLSFTGRPETGHLPGYLAIAGACLAWAVDNNLTRKVSGADPLSIATLKGFCAGTVNTLLAILFGARLPALGPLVTAAILGWFGYGVSLALFVLALRHLGTARTGAYFSTAPFVGAAVSIFWLNDPINASFVAAAILMLSGVWLYLTERHEHPHTHEPIAHQHSHRHDEHHDHRHSPGDPPAEPHVHPHRHTPITHMHHHYPDLHHRHHT